MLTIRNNVLQEFIDIKAIISFCSRLELLLQSVDILYTLFKWATGIWHLSIKLLNNLWKAVQVWFIYLKYSMWNGRFTWKIELLSLGCCIWWTISVVSIKFTVFVVWILTYQFWKFGSNPCIVDEIQFLWEIVLIVHPVYIHCC